jgi:hypothetical protein
MPRRLRGRAATIIRVQHSSQHDSPSMPQTPSAMPPPGQRLVADTSDEEANLPNPLDMDEEIILPQRPTIGDTYRRTTHHDPPPRHGGTATGISGKAGKTAAKPTGKDGEGGFESKVSAE